jgi:hypothetical protein
MASSSPVAWSRGGGATNTITISQRRKSSIFKNPRMKKNEFYTQFGTR